MNIFDLIINQPLGFILGFIYNLVNSYGLALVIFTIIVKIILFPLSLKQQKSMAKTAILQPKIAELQKKYKHDKEKQSQELMKLYKEEGANPASGCLPMLIQLPIIFGLYQVITKPLTYIVGMSAEQITSVVAKLGLDIPANQIGMQQINIAQSLADNMAKFPEFTSFNMIDFNFLGINLAGTPSFAINMLLLIPIFAGVTAYLSSWYTMNFGPSAAMANEQAKSMNKSMMITMPLMSVWFTFTLPAGVGIYWIMSNVLMVVQQWVLNKMFPTTKPEVLKKKGKKDNAERFE